MAGTAVNLRLNSAKSWRRSGGAALSARFTRMKIAPEYDGVVAYANDAMDPFELTATLGITA